MAKQWIVRARRDTERRAEVCADAVAAIARLKQLESEEWTAQILHEEESETTQSKEAL